MVPDCIFSANQSRTLGDQNSPGIASERKTLLEGTERLQEAVCSYIYQPCKRLHDTLLSFHTPVIGLRGERNYNASRSRRTLLSSSHLQQPGLGVQGLGKP